MTSRCQGKDGLTPVDWIKHNDPITCPSALSIPTCVQPGAVFQISNACLAEGYENEHHPADIHTYPC